MLVALLHPAAQAAAFVDDLLRRKMRFSAADLRSLDAGAAVVKSLETPVRRELAHFGVVYIQTPPERLIELFRDIERFESGPGVPQIGRFSVVPQLQDLASLTLPVEDVEALRTCRPGDCDMKLSAAAMSRFRNQVNWSSPNAARDANEVAREMILELVRKYQANGNDALGRYDDGGDPLPVAEEFRALLPNGDSCPLPCRRSSRILRTTRAVAPPGPRTSSTGRSSTSDSSLRSGQTMSRFIRCPVVRRRTSRM